MFFYLTNVALDVSSGALWWLIISRLADGDFTFFNQPASNRLMCDKPRKKHMKCTVYKDGVKTGSIIK